jgi:sulfite exporter TauE/SafE
MDALPLAMLAAGAASGVHCVGMCGGITTAFSGRVISLRAAGPPPWARQLAFNAGRIATYSIAGAAAGALGAAAYAALALPAQQVVQIALNILLIAVGLYLAGATRLLAPLERLGAPLWARLQPLAARLPRGESIPRLFAAGLVWGWLPCAMVYAALAAAAFAGSAAAGALAMAAFGAGTLPFLLAAGWLAGRLRAWRALTGAVVFAFGTYGLAHAGGFSGGLVESIRRGLLCL